MFNPTGNRLRPGAAPGMPGAGFLLPPPVRGRKPEFRGRAAPGIPGFDSGGGNRGRESKFEVYFHVEMHVKALRPILPQAMNNKVKTYKFCVFTCEQLHSLLGESLYMYLNVLHAQSSEQKRMKLVTWMRGA